MNTSKLFIALVFIGEILLSLSSYGMADFSELKESTHSIRTGDRSIRTLLKNCPLSDDQLSTFTRKFEACVKEVVFLEDPILTLRFKLITGTQEDAANLRILFHNEEDPDSHVAVLINAQMEAIIHSLSGKPSQLTWIILMSYGNYFKPIGHIETPENFTSGKDVLSFQYSSSSPLPSYTELINLAAEDLLHSLPK